MRRTGNKDQIFFSDYQTSMAEDFFRHILTFRECENVKVRFLADQ